MKSTSAFAEKKNAHFMQTPQWAGVKAEWKSDIIVLRQEGKNSGRSASVAAENSWNAPFSSLCAKGAGLPKTRSAAADAGYFPLCQEPPRFLHQNRSYVPAKDSDYHALLKQMGFADCPLEQWEIRSPSLSIKLR